MSRSYSFSCADAGVQCGATMHGDTEEEVLGKAVEHARNKHGVDLTESTTLAKFAQSAIRHEEGPADDVPVAAAADEG